MPRQLHRTIVSVLQQFSTFNISREGVSERCAQIAGTAHSVCEDYRASSTIDLEHDRLDVAARHKLQQPLRVLWGEHGTVGQCFDVMAL